MNSLEYIYTKAIEEAGEVSHALSKSNTFGIDDIDPRNGRSNRDQIILEYHDLQALLIMLNVELTKADMEPIDLTVDETKISDKIVRVVDWAKHSVINGVLDKDLNVEDYPVDTDPLKLSDLNGPGFVDMPKVWNGLVAAAESIPPFEPTVDYTSMQMFACDECSCVDAIQLAYNHRHMEVVGPPSPWLCTLCQGNRWHNHFPRVPYNPATDRVVNRSTGGPTISMG
jgi:hypothetical protein